jgi:hypothetical protein
VNPEQQESHLAGKHKGGSLGKVVVRDDDITPD